MDQYQYQKCIEALQNCMNVMRDAKPNDRSEDDRRVAISITMLEQAIAYFIYWTNCDRHVE